KNVRLYELGNIYLPESLPLTQLPQERMMFTLGMYGDGDFFDMKGVVEEFLDKVGMDKKKDYDPKAGKNFLHPGRQALIRYEGEEIGYLGEVHPQVRSEEHTSELQSRFDLVCRLLLEKKKIKKKQRQDELRKGYSKMHWNIDPLET